MKSTISVEQRFSSLATLGGNTPWDTLTTEQVQLIHREPGIAARAGEEYAEFVRAGYRINVQYVDLFRETGELAIQIPALPRPTLKELQEKHPGIKSVERDTSPVEPVTLTLATVLLPWEEKAISGEEYERRIAARHHELLGYQQRQWLLERQQEFPEFMQLLGKIWIDFPGVVVVSEDGNRNVPYALQHGASWVEHWFWLERGVCPGVRVARARK